MKMSRPMHLWHVLFTVILLPRALAVSGNINCVVKNCMYIVKLAIQCYHTLVPSFVFLVAYKLILWYVEIAEAGHMSHLYNQCAWLNVNVTNTEFAWRLTDVFTDSALNKMRLYWNSNPRRGLRVSCWNFGISDVNCRPNIPKTCVYIVTEIMTVFVISCFIFCHVDAAVFLTNFSSTLQNGLLFYRWRCACEFYWVQNIRESKVFLFMRRHIRA